MQVITPSFHQLGARSVPWLLLLLLLGHAPLPVRPADAAAASEMSPADEAKAREMLRSKLAESDATKAPATTSSSGSAGAVAPGERPWPTSPPKTPPSLIVPPPRFEPWPTAPTGPGAGQPIAPGTAPLPTEAPSRNPIEQARGKTLYRFRAEDLDLKVALAMFGRQNKLNIVPDQDVTGTVTLDVQDLPLDRMMQALLEAHDFTWSEEDGLIRVRSTQTRIFNVDYLRMTREGRGSSVVTLSSGSTTSGMSSGAGGGGAGLAGGTGGGAGGGAGGAGMVGGNTSGSSMNLKLENPIEFWKELEDQIKKLLSEVGKNNLALNMTAGVIQVTDRPSALKRVDSFLAQLTQSVARQVDIEAKIYDVTLSDQFQFGIDWARIVESQGGQFLFSGFPTVAAPAGEFSLKKESLAMSFTDKKTSVILKALQEQGHVSVVSQPRLRTLNNQTAIMKVGRDEPFFTQFSQVVASAGAEVSQTGDILSIITVGTVLAITPQIATNGWISLDISPAITSLVDTITSPSGNSSAPVLDIKQTSTLVRVRDGETIVIGGLIQSSDARSLRKVPWIADVPLLGKLFQGRFDAKQKKELVIFLTPTVVH